MAIGDQNDMKARIVALLPQGWFPDSAPVRDALLSGFAWCLSLVYSLIQYAQLQTRIATPTDGFLDLISFDFFGNNLPRNQPELDPPFRSRILATLLRPKATRPGMIAVLTALTGRAPIIFEPARPLDTGAYGASICGYGMAGGYGSLLLTAQAFIKAFRPAASGIPYVAGYGSSSGAYSTASRAEWCSLGQIQGAVTDAAIFATIAATKAEGTEMWVQLSN
jgi:hypothetical protein